MRRQHQRWTTGMLGAGLALGGGLANAQLGSFGQTELQAVTGSAVQTVCGGFINNQDANTAEEQDLFDICGEMVHTARVLAGEEADVPGRTNKSLDLTADELAAALQQIANEETIAPSTLLTETSFGQFGNLFARLTSLRGGATGLSISGLNLNMNGRQLHANTLTATPRGGAAGDESAANWGRLGAFINGDLGFGEVDATDREDGLEFDGGGITAGLDYRINDNAVIGAALGYTSLDADFDSSATVSGGEVDADGYTLAVFGSYFTGDFYVDGVIGYGSNDYDLTRRIVVPTNSANPDNQGANRTATADTDSDQFALSISAGYMLNSGALSYGPYARLSYLDGEIDAYEEQGAAGLNLAVDKQDVESLVTAIGGQVAYASSQSFGVVQPYARLEWHHEFRNDTQLIRAQYVFDPRDNPLVVRTDSPDRNYFLLGLGASAIFQGGVQGFASYETTLGLDDVEDHRFTLGARFEF